MVFQSTQLSLFVFAFALLCLLLFFLLRKRIRRAPVALTSIFDELPPSQWLLLKPSFKQKIHYVQWGAGPDILLIHGIGASVYCWRKLAPLLAQLSPSFRVTAIDLPGFGFSTKDPDLDYSLEGQCSRLADLITQLGLSPHLVVGSSMGGLIALYLATFFAEKAPRVVALAPALDRKLVPLPFDSLAKFAPLFHKKVESRTIGFLLKRVVNNPDLISEETIRNYFRPFENDPLAATTFAKALRSIRSKDNPQFLKKLSSSALLLHGAKDRIISARVSMRAQKKFRQLQLLIHPSAGHHLQEDDPEWVAEQIKNFLNQH